MLKPKTKPFLPANRQGVAGDALSIALNLFLFPIFSSRMGSLFDEVFRDNEAAFKILGALMFLILGGRLGGLYLKRFPLQARLEKSGQTAFPLYFFILNTPVLIMTAAFVGVFFLYLSVDLGIAEKGYNNLPKESQAVSLFGVLAIVLLMCLEIYLLYRLTKPLGEKEKQMQAQGDWKFGLKSELSADFGLFGYMMIWQVFYHQTAATLLTPPANVTETFGFKTISLVFTLFCFLLFYLSPRAVFLVEDRRYWGTWLFILLVFMSSIVRYV